MIKKSTAKKDLYQIRVDSNLKESLKSIPTAYVRLELKRIVDKYKIMHRSVSEVNLGDDKDTRSILKDLIKVI